MWVVTVGALVIIFVLVLVVHVAQLVIVEAVELVVVVVVVVVVPCSLEYSGLVWWACLFWKHWTLVVDLLRQRVVDYPIR